MKNLILLFFISLVTSSSSYAVKPQFEKGGSNKEAQIIPYTTIHQAPPKHGSLYSISRKIRQWLDAITPDESKDAMIIALIAHLGWLGLLVAFILNNNTNYPLSNFYIRQLLGLYLLRTIFNILAQIVLIIISYSPLITNISLFSFQIVSGILILIALFFTVLWIISLIGAFQRKETPIPIFGKLFQKWFKNI